MSDHLGIMSQFGGSWLRLRTIIIMRWTAAVGQSIAILVAITVYHLRLETGLVIFAIGLSVLANLIAMAIYPEDRHISQLEGFFMLLFDLFQLGFLLYLCGGLHNPFGILILAPVMVSATALDVRLHIVMCAVAIGVVTLLALYHLQLRTKEGFVLWIPDVFVFGNWIAIVVSIVFLSYMTWRITSESRSMSEALQATQMALAREQKLTDIGGVVAAAAHELGTPLATIKLTAAELAEELDTQPELQDDARLIHEQADRCRAILHSMGRAGKDDMHMRTAPLSAVIEEAAEPHLDRGVDVVISPLAFSPPATRQPHIFRRPEIIHGLRNLVQNAVDFADQTIEVGYGWDDDRVIIRITDDGPGFPQSVISRIGEPMLRSRKSPRRSGYNGMGLGLFIAKTLLERSGAELSFANGPGEIGEELSGPDAPQKGAIIEATWPRNVIEAQKDKMPPRGASNPLMTA